MRGWRKKQQLFLIILGFVVLFQMIIKFKANEYPKFANQHQEPIFFERI